MCNGAGQTTSFKYMNSTFDCVSHQSGPETPNVKPAASRCGRFKLSSKSGIHVAAKPAYSGHDLRSAARIEPEMNVRSNSRTMSGAETMTSLEVMPQRQDTTARANQIRFAVRRSAVNKAFESCSAATPAWAVSQYRRL